MALAGAASAVAAIERNIDLGAKGRVGDEFMGFAGNDPRYAVLELQSNVV
jgi:hypothetical protein